MEIGIYIGTYTPAPGYGTGEGIYYFSIDESGYVKSPVRVVAKAEGSVVNPSYLIISEDQRYLYGVNEVNAGSVTRYEINEDCSLGTLNTEITALSSPVFLLFDSSEEHLIVANYGDGSPNYTSGVTVFPTKSETDFPHFSQLIQYSSVTDPSHAHGLGVKTVQGKEYLFVTDLGSNTLYCYAINRFCEQPLTLYASAHGTNGQGPRHIAVSKDGKYLYVINEFDPAYPKTSSISIFSFSPCAAMNNRLTYLKSVASEMSLYSGKGKCNCQSKDLQSKDKLKNSAVQNYPAGVVIHQDNLYVSNRGDENIAHFKIINEGSDLKYVSEYHLAGYDWPREFAITPNGKFLVAAYQHSNNVVIFKVELDGSLSEVKQDPIEIGSPVAIAFIT